MRRRRDGSESCPGLCVTNRHPVDGGLLDRIATDGIPCHPPRGALPVPKYVYDFSEGTRDMKDLLGGKGANLAEMTNIGLPVPPGFIITTEACRTYLESGDAPAEMEDEISQHLAHLEKEMGKTLGDADDPLLVSVRAGAKFSMPGMMDTVLNIGLNDQTVVGLANLTGDERFAWDSYRRLVQMYGAVVLGVHDERFEEVLADFR